MRKVNLPVLLLTAMALFGCKVEKKQQVKVKIPIESGYATMNGNRVDSLDLNQLAEGVHLLEVESEYFSFDFMKSFMLVRKDNKQIDFSIQVRFNGPSKNSIVERAFQTFQVESLEEMFAKLEQYKENGTVKLDYYSYTGVDGKEKNFVGGSTNKTGQYSVAIKKSNKDFENSSFTKKVNDSTYLVQLIGRNGEKIQKTITIKEVKPGTITDTSSIWYVNSNER